MKAVLIRKEGQFLYLFNYVVFCDPEEKLSAVLFFFSTQLLDNSNEKKSDRQIDPCRPSQWPLEGDLTNRCSHWQVTV